MSKIELEKKLSFYLSLFDSTTILLSNTDILSFSKSLFAGYSSFFKQLDSNSILSSSFFSYPPSSSPNFNLYLILFGWDFFLNRLLLLVMALLLFVLLLSLLLAYAYFNSSATYLPFSSVPIVFHQVS